MAMHVVGLTGPMGAGKTLVLEQLRLRGAVCLRADDASRELLGSDRRLLALVRDTLGDSVFGPDGALDRRRTARVVFRDPVARAALEAIVHPPMVAWLREHLEALRGGTHPPTVAVVEAAILTHMGARDLVDTVVRVWAPPETCAVRIAERDGVGLAEARERVALHVSLGLFDEPADFVLDASGSLAETGSRVGELWDWLTQAGPGPA
jgi:dephospho-CoA kinase